MVLCAEVFTDFLKSKGLPYRTKDLPDGGICVSVPFDGRTTNMFFDGDDDGSHVALRTVFEHCPEERVADLLLVCNELNVQFRWLKFCVDNDNDIMVEDDAIVSPDTAASECFELLLHTVSILGEAKPVIMRALYA